MMTKAELDELVKCPHTAINTEGTEYKDGDTLAGYRVSGQGDYSANSIFLPAASSGNGSSLIGSGLCGAYWSSTPGSVVRNACYLDFNSSDITATTRSRSHGLSVRAVRDAK